MSSTLRRTRWTIILLTAIFLCSGSANAVIDATTYPFSNATGVALEDMSSGTTQLVAANLDDTASAVTNIGFDFWYHGVRHTQFSVNANGLLRLGPSAVSTAFDNGTGFVSATNAPKIAPYFDDLWVGTNGKVHSKVVGSAPNRKLVVEWLNMQIPRVAAGNPGAGTFQLWLSESTGLIQVVYGSGIALNSANSGYSVGLNIGSPVTNNTASVTTTTPAVSYTVANNTQTNAITSGDSYSFTPPVPNAPSGLNFTAVTPISMTLNWSDNSSDEFGFAIERSLDGTNFTFVTTTAVNATSFAATGLTPATNYFWRVYAVSSGAVSTVIAGSQATAPPGNISSTGAGGLWSDTATWVGGVVPIASDNVTIVDGATVTIDTAALAYTLTVGQGASGVLQFESTTARTLVVGGAVTVAAGGTFQSNPAGTQTGHGLSVGGDLTNNGTLDFSTNGNTAGAVITFTGAANATFSGSGATTDIRQITMNKGNSTASTLELMPANFTAQGVTDNTIAGWLTYVNGTMKISGTFAMDNRTFTTPTYVIPATGGIWLNNPNYTVSATASGSATAVTGLFRITQGVYNIGIGAGDQMRGNAGALFQIEGGTVNVSGAFDPQSAVTYNQSGGVMNVGTVGNNVSNFGTFELFSSTSTFIMSGGTINVINPSTGATKVDWQVRSPTANTNITGGVAVIGASGAPASSTYNVVGQMPSVTVSPTMTMAVNAATVFFRGNTLTNNGAITSIGASPRFDFASQNSAMTYGGSGEFGTLLAPFGGVGISANSTFLTTLNSPIVCNRVNLFQGGFINSNQFTLGNGGASTTVVQIGSTGLTTPGGSFDVSPAHNQGTGGEIVLYAFETAPRITGFEINPTRVLTSINSVDNPNTVTLSGGDLTLSSPGAAIVLTNGRFITGANTLILSSDTATVTRTNGYVDGNFRKHFAAAASKNFEVGTVNGYSPVTVNATGGSFPADVTVAAAQTFAPGISPTSIAIERYWDLTATGITADLTFTYVDPLDFDHAPITEANLLAYSGDGISYTSYPGTILATGPNTAQVLGVSASSHWTLAEPGALVSTDVSVTKDDGVTVATPGGSTVYTIVASNAGPSDAVSVAVTDNPPAACATFTYTSVPTGGATGNTSGAGNIADTLNLPVGATVTYTATCAIKSNATGSLVNTATVLSAAFDPDSSNDSATDTDTLAPEANLGITKSDGVTIAPAGGSVTYTIVASNAGPSSAPGSSVVDSFDAVLSCSTTCVGSGGGSCTAGPILTNINDTVNLPVGGSVTYTAVCAVDGGASGSLVNTATVATAGGVTDPVPGNNSATDTDTIGQQADLAITKTDGVTVASPGTNTTYTIVASNLGPSDAPTAAVIDIFPAACTSASWTCSGSGGGSCAAAGVGNINQSVNLPSGGSVTFLAVCAISGSATGTLSNTATIGVGVNDPNTANNSATDVDSLSNDIFIDGFESGSTGQWSATVPLTFEAYSTTAIPAGATETSFGYDFSATRPGEEVVPNRIASATDASGNRFFEVLVRRSEATSTLEWTLEVAGGGRSSWVPVAEVAQEVRIEWASADQGSLGHVAVVLDGRLALWVDGGFAAGAPVAVDLFRAPSPAE